MLLALCLAAAAPLAAERTLVVDGKAIAIPAAAQGSGATLRIDLLVSSEERTLLATLLHRGWTPRDPASHPAYPEWPIALGGRDPDLDLEHAGAHIDERLRLLLWRRPERLRALPLWIGVVARQSGVGPLLPPKRPPVAAHDALDHALADFSFGLSQARAVASQPRVTWVELVEAPQGAEDLLVDLLPAAEPPMQPATPHPEGPPSLKPLPSFQPVVAEVISRPEGAGRRVALTFDACSTLDRSFYDDRVTRALVKTQTPATLFISGRWAETHLRQMRPQAHADMEARKLAGKLLLIP
ncbi:MAG: polysaccharide deacetylase family protein [Myxococcales bacterium]